MMSNSSCEFIIFYRNHGRKDFFKYDTIFILIYIKFNLDFL